jgi:GNAT superfamily N-acetyltransferase
MLDTLRYKLRHYPLPRLMLNALKRVGITIVPYYLFTYSTASSRGANELRNCRLVELHADDMAGVAALPMTHSTEQAYRNRLGQGHRCYGLLLDDELVAYSWIDPRRCSYPGEVFDLAAGEVYAYDLFTVPSQRGRDLAPLLVALRNEMMRASGITTVYGVVDYFNRPSLRFGEKVGTRWQRLNLYVSLFGLIKASIVLKTYRP